MADRLERLPDEKTGECCGDCSHEYVTTSAVAQHDEPMMDERWIQALHTLLRWSDSLCQSNHDSFTSFHLNFLA